MSGPTRFAETVVRHPFTGWAPDRNGNPSNKPLFGVDIAIERVDYADGDWTGEPADSGTDSVVQTRATLFLPADTATDPHDEWTARGLRWHQVGRGKDWRTGVVVLVERREG